MRSGQFSDRIVTVPEENTIVKGFRSFSLNARIVPCLSGKLKFTIKEELVKEKTAESFISATVTRKESTLDNLRRSRLET